MNKLMPPILAADGARPLLRKGRLTSRNLWGPQALSLVSEGGLNRIIAQRSAAFAKAMKLCGRIDIEMCPQSKELESHAPAWLRDLDANILMREIKQGMLPVLILWLLVFGLISRIYVALGYGG